ncbi:MAG: glycoside hydrolase family 25 protein [Ruminococcus sp.]|nr:glycoside hydrolase family 25 protein [Ruminococcus sp.]
MKKCFQALSAVLSVVLVGSAYGVSAFAEDSSSYNYSTFASESKDLTKKSVSARNIPSAGSSESPFDVFKIYKDHMEAEKAPYNIYRESWGIDVSEHQGYIDWVGVKNSGVDFAIIRAGYGNDISQIDDTFIQNMKGAQSVGLDVGTYWYSYAVDVEDAYREAETCYEIIKNYDFQYPVYFDIEDPMYANYSAAQISAIIDAFCTRLQEKGCYVGVYSYTSFLNTKVYDFIYDKYDVWVAEYGTPAPVFNYDYRMWQYASDGCGSQVNGIFTDNLDLNHCYVDYPYIITGRKSDTSTETPVVPPIDTPVVPPVETPVDPPVETPSDPPVYIEQTVEAKGIDVSAWQGIIDWFSVAKDNIDFAIIRVGYGMYETQKDYYFEQNYKNAKAAGLDVGAYWYSYAQTPEEAIREAELFCKFVDGYKFEYPLYVELDASVSLGLTNSERTAVIDTFCSYVQQRGYFIGIMGAESFLKNQYDESLFNKYAVWISSYKDTIPVFSKFVGMWQYSGTGTVNGIDGYVNSNYCFDTYPQIMKDVHLNGY